MHPPGPPITHTTHAPPWPPYHTHHTCTPLAPRNLRAGCAIWPPACPLFPSPPPPTQVLKEVVKVPGLASTTCSLLYSNTTEADILLKEELDMLAAQNPDRIKVGGGGGPKVLAAQNPDRIKMRVWWVGVCTCGLRAYVCGVMYI